MKPKGDIGFTLTLPRPTYKNDPYNMGGICMRGSVKYNKKTKTWYVRWYDSKNKKDVKIYHYKGIKIREERLANRLLQDMRSDFEDGTFYIEKYKQKGFSDIVSFIGRISINTPKKIYFSFPALYIRIRTIDNR